MNKKYRKEKKRKEEKIKRSEKRQREIKSEIEKKKEERDRERRTNGRTGVGAESKDYDGASVVTEIRKGRGPQHRTADW